MAFILLLSVLNANEINETMIIENIIPKLSKPVITDLSKDIRYIQVPQVLLSRDDYMMFVLYLKYLSSQHKSDKVAKLYVESIRGLNSVDNIYITTLNFRIDIITLLLNSLKYDISHSLLPQDIEYINSNLPNLSTLKQEDFRLVLDELMRGDFETVFVPMLKMVYGDEYAKFMRMGLANLFVDFYDNMSSINSIEDRDKFIKSYNDNRDRFILRHLQQVASIQYKINPHIKNNDIDRYTLPKPIVNQEIGVYTTIKAIFYMIPKMKLESVGVDLLEAIKLNDEVRGLLQSKEG